MDENIKNLTMDDVLDVIGKFPWKPSFNKVIITLNMVAEDGELQLSNTMVDEIQYVVAAGEMAEKQFPAGSKILLDLEKMMFKVPDPQDQTQVIHQIKLEPIVVDEVTYAIIEDRLIKAKYIGNE